jgi:heme/copper-type cytochrome/quinol oxidase subunit 2
MPSFTFGPNQLFIIITGALLFAFVCAVIWYVKEHGKVSDTEAAGLNRLRHFVAFVSVLIIAIAVFFTAQEQGASLKSIKKHIDPPVVEMTPRSVIEETNDQKATERRQARREEIQSTTEELEEDSASFFDKLMKRERAQRETESKPDK